MRRQIKASMEARAWRCVRSLLVAVAVLAASAAPASAEFTPTAYPFSAGLPITGFAVSGDRWLAISATELERRPVARVSDDSGLNWRDLPLPEAVAELGREASVGPDGSVWLAAKRSDGAGLLRLRPDAAAVEQVSVGLGADDPDIRLSPPAFDDGGRMWLAGHDWSTQTLTLGRIGSDGEVAEQASVQASAGGPVVRSVAQGVWVEDESSGLWRYDGGSLVSKGRVGLPVWSEDRRLVTRRGLSQDGGETFVARNTTVGEAVGNPSLLTSVAPAGSGAFITQILRRSAGEAPVFGPVATAPARTNVLWATRRGLLALRVLRPGTYPADEEPFALDPVVTPGWPESDGALSGATLTHLRRVNELRADAGLPPMIGDQRVQQAAENHSRYWTLNAPDPNNPLSIHEEVEGAPGFTGVHSWERCAATGAAPCSEVVFGSRVRGAFAVDGWAVTPFHGPLIFGNRNARLGTGEVEAGPTVTNFTVTGLEAGPVVYPRGRYDARRGFTGESPDPVTECAKVGYQVSYPVGTAVSFVAPAGFGVRAIRVMRESDGAALAGCQLITAGRAQFIPDEPLEMTTGYRAEAVWEPTPGQPSAYEWRFATTATDNARYSAPPPPPPPTSSGGGSTGAPLGTPQVERPTPPSQTSRLPQARLSFRATVRRGRLVLRGTVRPASPRTRVTIVVSRGSKRRTFRRRLSAASRLKATLRPPRGSRKPLRVRVEVPETRWHAKGSVSLRP